MMKLSRKAMGLFGSGMVLITSLSCSKSEVDETDDAPQTGKAASKPNIHFPEDSSGPASVYEALHETRATEGSSSGGDQPRSDEPEWKVRGDSPPDQAMVTAVVGGDLDALEEYIEAGGNVNARSPSGATLLSTAVVYARPETFEMLVGAGADVTLSDHKGYAPLHTAVFFGQTEMVRGLLQAGADPYQQSNKGHLPFGVVTATFEQMRPHYDRIGSQLEVNNGILLDLERIRASREPIIRLLEESGAP